MNEVLTSVNRSLLVSNSDFEDQYNNVDSLIVLSHGEYDIRRKLKILQPKLDFLLITIHLQGWWLYVSGF